MLRSLEGVTIARCEKVMKIFWLPMGEEEHMPLSTLKKLRLEALPSLFSIWNSSKSLVRLQNLTVVEIRDCRFIKFIFPHSIAQSLQRLEIPKIKGCQFLKRIVQGDQTDHTQAVGFPNLKVLQVEDCTDLTSLFSVTTAQSLRQLKELTIVKCEQLVEIISHIKEGEEEEEENDEDILLPKVRSFEVRDLSSLKRLCSENFCVNLPALKELVVDRCPMMGMLAADAAAYGLQSASKTMKIQVDGQTLSATAVQKIFSGKLFSITPLLLGLHKGHHPLLNHGTLNPTGESDQIGTAQGGLGGWAAFCTALAITTDAGALCCSKIVEVMFVCVCCQALAAHMRLR
ncbi:hypothetical protein TEA_000846 [Camellia sinensis var. sinensis]|uniref:Disease resistance protein At4g27190-like leucine-rich repeats domain-containing protein n=1 Tax=Camellia sinensis var. sinensis TaxID=542762 RepID=A0A4S4DKD6_CAMSN|nr:hypothetical protein TEA_000846 [Camellia sinensis var. sinensis]